MSIYFLGTEKHHRQYLRDVGTLVLPGCFAMTETGHGSNVRGIETTATYQHGTRSFIIHTPNQLAQKEYIGNAACPRSDRVLVVGGMRAASSPSQ
jgi:acyl-CoA oxidase